MSENDNGVERVLADTAEQIVLRYGAVVDRHVAFTVGELSPARYAFLRAGAETSNRNLLGHLMFLRLVAEIGVRFAWVVSRANGDGGGVRRGVDALAKRDLMHLRAGNKAIGLSGANAHAMMATIAEKEAPAQIHQLAEATPLAAQSYAMFRFTSALVHPGFGMRDLLRGAPDMQIGLRDAMTTCIALGAEMLALLAPHVERVNVDAMLRHDILAYSPTAISLRLRRSLRRLHGQAAPEVENVSMTIASNSDGWTQTLEAKLRRKSRGWTVRATAEEPSDAYDALERQALGGPT